MDYAPSIFTMPTTLGFSKGHEVTLRILEGLVEMLPFFQGCNKWTITNEHRNPYKHGYKKWMRYDIALWKNDDLWGLIEFDGKQHFEKIELKMEMLFFSARAKNAFAWDPNVAPAPPKRTSKRKL
jgi:hypothetical protein